MKFKIEKQLTKEEYQSMLNYWNQVGRFNEDLYFKIIYARTGKMFFKEVIPKDSIFLELDKFLDRFANNIRNLLKSTKQSKNSNE